MAVTANTLLAATRNETDASSYTTASVSPTAGRLQLLVVHSNISASAEPNAPTVTGAGMTWTRVGGNWYGTNYKITVFRALSLIPGSGALTIDFGGQTQQFAQWTLTEFGNVKTTGTNGADAVVQVVSTNSSGGVTSHTVTLAAFSDTNNATWGALGITGNRTVTEGSGFTQLAEIVNTISPDGTLNTEWKNSNDTTVDWSWSLVRPCTGTAIEIAEAAYRACTDTIVGTEVVTRSSTRSRTASDTALGSDAATCSFTSVRTATDASVGSDSATRLVTVSRTCADTALGSDAATAAFVPGTVSFARTCSDATLGSDNATRSSTRSRTCSDTLAALDVGSAVCIVVRGLAQALQQAFSSSLSPFVASSGGFLGPSLLGGRMVVDPDAIAGNGAVSFDTTTYATFEAYDLRESHYLFEMALTLDVGHAAVFVAKAVILNRLGWGEDMAAGVQVRWSVARSTWEIWEDTYTGAYVDYDATAHRWLRFRLASGTFYVDASFDSNTWTNLWSRSLDWYGATDLDADGRYTGLLFGVNANATAAMQVDNINLRVINRACTDTSISTDVVTRSSTRSRTVSDTAIGSDAVIRTGTFTRSCSDVALGSDAAALAFTYDRACTDTLTLSDSETHSVSLSRITTDSLAPTDAAVGSATFVRTADDSLETVESVVSGQIQVRTADDNFDPTDAATSVASQTRTVTDDLLLVDASVQVAAGVRAVANILAFDDMAAQVSVVVRAITDAFLGADAVAATATAERTATDTALGGDTASGGVAGQKVGADGFDLTEATTRLVALSRIATDSFDFIDLVAPLSEVVRSTNDAFDLTDTATQTSVWTRATTDFVDLTDAVVGTNEQVGVAADALTLTDSTSAVASYGRITTDAISSVDVAVRVQVATRVASDSVSAVDLLARNVATVRAATDTALGADLAIRLLVRLTQTTNDSASLTDAAAKTSAADRTCSDELAITNVTTRLALTFLRSTVDLLLGADVVTLVAKGATFPACIIEVADQAQVVAVESATATAIDSASITTTETEATYTESATVNVFEGCEC